MTHPLPSQSSNPWSFLPFALTIFTSAFLLFQVQPLLSKQILPWFGGSPAVWTTAMLFFQSLLCMGYLYAHALAALPSRKTQARIHVILLVLAALLACHVLFRFAGQAPDRVRQAAGALTAVVMVALLFAMENPWSWRDVHKGDRTEVLLDQVRNFYGTVAVKERRFTAEPERNDRVFFSGNVTHGQQFLSDKLRHVPTTYYAQDSGIGETLQWAMSQKASLSVALIGLGAGTLANYARPADAYDFYEINPAAVRIAQEWFDNLSTCKAGEQNILLGDARLRMEQLPKDKLYDVIVLDAFTGGSVPIHLLTREAFQIYRDHLKPDGHIAINITNAYLNLYPIVKAQAEVLGMAHRHKYQNLDAVRNVRRNLHFIMTHDQAYLKAYPSVNRDIRDEQGRVLRQEPVDQPGLRLWTDQFSSIAPIVR